MKAYTTESIRNLCLAGQRGCGKTSVADAIAFCAGLNNRIGAVDSGSSFLDYHENEIARKTTISSKLLACEWKKNKLNLLDCPGHVDFVGEFLSCLKVSDAVGIVINGTSGVEIGTRLQWKAIENSGVSRFFFVNKMETENVNWKANLDSIRDAFGKQVVAVQIPVGEASSFKGLIDLLHMKAYTYDADGNRTEVEIPAELKDIAQAEREHLIENAAETDDELLEKFFEVGTLEDSDVLKGLSAGIAGGKLYPVLFGSAHKNAGIKVLMDFVVEYLPSPDRGRAMKLVKSDGEEPVDAVANADGDPLTFVFKTVSEGHLGELSYFRTVRGTLQPGCELHNQKSGAAERITQIYTIQGKNRVDVTSVPAGDLGVLAKLKSTHTGDSLSLSKSSEKVVQVEYPNPVMDVAVQPKSKGDEDKLASGLAKLGEEDLTFRFVPDPALKQQVLWAQGSTHIDIITDKLKERFGVEVDLSKPKTPYRETVTSSTEKEYQHKKQSGGRGQYAKVLIRIEPNTRGGGFEFVNAIKGGNIPTKFIPAVEKGLVEQMANGGLCGSQVVDLKVTLYDGKFHEVDSSDMAFKIAGLMALKEGFMDCRPVLLEPIYNLEVTVPDDCTGDVMGDLSGRRGRIAGMDPDGHQQTVRASVPQAELYQYSVDLRSMTQGQGMYSMSFSHYEEVPHDVAQKVIEAARLKREADAE